MPVRRTGAEGDREEQHRGGQDQSGVGPNQHEPDRTHSERPRSTVYPLGGSQTEGQKDVQSGAPDRHVHQRQTGPLVEGRQRREPNDARPASRGGKAREHPKDDCEGHAGEEDRQADAAGLDPSGTERPMDSGEQEHPQEARDPFDALTARVEDEPVTFRQVAGVPEADVRVIHAHKRRREHHDVHDHDAERSERQPETERRGQTQLRSCHGRPDRGDGFGRGCRGAKERWSRRCHEVVTCQRRASPSNRQRG